LPWLAEPSSGWIVKLAVFAFKMSFFMLLIMLIRWTIPRFRFDQLMNLAWTVLIPLALANLVAVMVVMQMEWSRWWLLPVSVALLIGAGAMGTRPAVKPRQV
jgi:NADH-quinone oxidoreductase subunit H